MSDKWQLEGCKEEIERNRKILSRPQRADWAAFVQRAAADYSIPDDDTEITALSFSERDKEMQAITLAGYALGSGIDPVFL